MAPTAHSLASWKQSRRRASGRRTSAASRQPAPFGLAYWREASQRPLHGIPADAPFHFPDPLLPLNWPLAYAPLMDTRTKPSCPMLPETFAPLAEILPSATVSIELALGSQLPLLVTIVTFQRPS